MSAATVTTFPARPMFDMDATRRFLASLTHPSNSFGEAAFDLGEYASGDLEFNPATWDDKTITELLIQHGLAAGVIGNVSAYDLLWWPNSDLDTYDPPDYTWTLDIAGLRLAALSNTLAGIGFYEDTDPDGFAGHAVAVLREAAAIAGALHDDLARALATHQP